MADSLVTPASTSPPDSLLTVDGRGLHCAAGGFHIDPWEPVERAVVTHAHADHARTGCASYLCSAEGAGVTRERLGGDAAIHPIPYGERIRMRDVVVSLHPAGHVLGSAQIRIEHGDDVWVVSGDYKTEADRTCTPFEPLRCRVFVSESTFGLPIYRWRPQVEILSEIGAWWRANQARGRASVLFAYALGKAQRVLAGIDPSIGPIVAHEAVARMIQHYRRAGVSMPEVARADALAAGDLRRALVVAPPSAQNTPWLKRFGEHSDAFASGWMQVRGTRRRKNVDRGFVLSDHADWRGLVSSIAATGCERVLITHGQVPALVRYLGERGLDAQPLLARFPGVEDEGFADAADDPRAAASAEGEDSGASGSRDDPSGDGS